MAARNSTSTGIADDHTTSIDGKFADRGTAGRDPIDLDLRADGRTAGPAREAPPSAGADVPEVGSAADRISGEIGGRLDLEAGIDGKGHDAPPGTGDPTGPDTSWMDAERPGAGDSFSIDGGPDGDFGRGDLAYDEIPELGSRWAPSEPANDMSTAAGDGTTKQIWTSRFQQAQDGGGTKAVKGLLDSVLSGNASDSAKLEAAEAAADVVEGAKAGTDGGDGDPAPPQGTGGTNAEYGEGYVDPTDTEPVDEYYMKVKFENATGGDIDHGDQVSGPPVAGEPEVYDGIDHGPDYVAPDLDDPSLADVQEDPGTIDPLDA